MAKYAIGILALRQEKQAERWGLLSSQLSPHAIPGQWDPVSSEKDKQCLRNIWGCPLACTCRRLHIHAYLHTNAFSYTSTHVHIYTKQKQNTILKMPLLQLTVNGYDQVWKRVRFWLPPPPIACKPCITVWWVQDYLHHPHLHLELSIYNLWHAVQSTTHTALDTAGQPTERT